MVTPLGSTIATMASPAASVGAGAGTSCKVRPEAARDAGAGLVPSFVN